MGRSVLESTVIHIQREREKKKCHILYSTYIIADNVIVWAEVGSYEGKEITGASTRRTCIYYGNKYIIYTL